MFIDLPLKVLGRPLCLSDDFAPVLLRFACAGNVVKGIYCCGNAGNFPEPKLVQKV